MRKTSIIILTYNNLEYTKLCIESVRKFTPEGSYETIVVDNCSSDGTAEWLREQPDIRLIANQRNEGFPAGCNQGIRAAEAGNDILLLNNDTIVTPQWLDALRTCLYSSPSIGAAGPVTNFCSNGQAIQTKFGDITEMLDFAAQFNASQRPEYECRQKLVGFCLLMKREAVDQIGLLDERFTPGNYEDDDYSYRIQEAGYRLLLCHSVFIYHFGSLSFHKDIQAYQRHLLVNEKKFEEKWGFNPRYSTYIRADVIRMIDNAPEDPIRVLEIGCACGATLLRIKHEYKNAELYGIELNSASAKVASQYCIVKSEDIEQSHLSFEENFFDYILFADVLEHLYDPLKVLATMKRYLKKDGHIVASIPNIMHYTVVAGLLGGNFTYEDAGILDRTHLRFFTWNEIVRLFRAGGYGNLQVRASAFPHAAAADAFVDKLVAIAGEDKREQFLAYQYVVKAGTEQEAASASQTASVHESAPARAEADSGAAASIPQSEQGRHLRFLLRRLEYHIDDEQNLQALAALLEQSGTNPALEDQEIERSAVDSASQYNMLGLAYYIAGGKQRAAECFLNAYERNPENPDVVFNTVSLLLEYHNIGAAKSILSRCDQNDERIRTLLRKTQEADL